MSRAATSSARSERYRWYALGFTTVCQAAVSTLSLSIGPLAPFIQADLGVTRAQIGLIRTMLTLSGAFVSLVGGWAADHVGERGVLILSGLLAGSLALTVAGVGVYWALLAVFFAIGIGFGIQGPAGSAAIVRWFPPRQRGFAMSIRQTGVPLGGMIGAGLGPVIALAYGWRMAFVFGGVLTILGAALIFFAYRDPEPATGAGRPAPRSMRDLLRDRQVWWLALIYNGQITAQYVVTTYLVLFLHDDLEYPVVSAAGILALVNVVSIVARIAWGTLSDRYCQGRRRPVLSLILWLTLAGTSATTLLPVQAPWLAVTAVAVVFGFSAFAWTAMFNTLAVETVGQGSAGTAVALISTLATPGALFGPPAFGLLADQSGSFRIAWAVLSLTALVSLLAMRQVAEHSGGASRTP